MQAAKDVSSFSSFKTAVEARKAALGTQPEPIEGEAQEADHAAAN
jgi:recombination protein RecT